MARCRGDDLDGGTAGPPWCGEGTASSHDHSAGGDGVGAEVVMQYSGELPAAQQGPVVIVEIVADEGRWGSSSVSSVWATACGEASRPSVLVTS